MKRTVLLLPALALVAGCATDSEYADYSGSPSITWSSDAMANNNQSTPSAIEGVGGTGEPAAAQAGSASSVSPTFSASATGQDASALISQWPARSRLGAQLMISQYGQPQFATAEKLIWENPGQFKRIAVSKEETPHNFPFPHMDYMEHTVECEVPAERVGEIAKFDGSVTVDRTRGELSARCDLESHNILALNIANEIATGAKDGQAARDEFTQIAMDEMRGKSPEMMSALQFKSQTGAGFTDQPSVPGAPVRAATESQVTATESAGTPGEVLGYIVAVDKNEITAASVAEKKSLNPELMAYAKMLHREHGENLEKTLQVGQQIDSAPIITAAVDGLLTKGADGLAKIVPLEGQPFSQAFLTMMIQGHQEALNLIDQQLLPKANDQALKQHLNDTRQSVANHLQIAQQLQSGTAVGAPGNQSERITGAGQSEQMPQSQNQPGQNDQPDSQDQMPQPQQNDLPKERQ